MDSVVIGVLITQATLGVLALVRASYLALLAAREARLIATRSFPRLQLSDRGKRLRHRAANCLGGCLLVLVAPWLLVSIVYAALNPPGPEDTRRFNVVFQHPDGRDIPIGTTQGLDACEAKAIHYAHASELPKLDWGYVCCLRTPTSECEGEYW
jgi:hypothetical protein